MGRKRQGGGVFLQVIAAEAGVAQKKMARFGVPYCYISKSLSFGESMLQAGRDPVSVLCVAAVSGGGRLWRLAV